MLPTRGHFNPHVLHPLPHKWSVSSLRPPASIGTPLILRISNTDPGTLVVLAVLSLLPFLVSRLLTACLSKSKPVKQDLPQEPLLYPADKDAAALSRNNKRRLASYPKGFPEGWYPLCFSDDLRKGDIKYIECVGHELAVYRDESGVAKTVDAHCPHLGANLAFGGTVIGDCIQCPFHLWQFDGVNGACRSIPYCSPVPSVAKTRHWQTVDYYGLVCMFYSPRDEVRVSPPYQLMRIPAIDSGEQVYRGRWEVPVKMHLQEFAENSVDFQHFQPLHGGMTIPFTDIPISFITIRHVADWAEDPDHRHIVRFLDHATLMFRGREIPHSSAKATITFQGPGGVVIFDFVTEVGKIVLVQSHAPLDSVNMQVRFTWFADRAIPRLLVSYVVGNWFAQWKRDVMVWENKIYLRKPLLVKGDGPVMKLRRWFAQFYAEETPSGDW